MTTKHGLIRIIYLYLFTIIGLALIVISSVHFIDLGIKTYILTGADEPERISQNYYRTIPITINKLEAVNEEDADFTAEEKELIKNYLANYKEWQEEESQIDYLFSRRQKEVANNIAMLLVGLPLYLYHWTMIKRDLREKHS